MKTVTLEELTADRLYINICADESHGSAQLGGPCGRCIECIELYVSDALKTQRTAIYAGFREAFERVKDGIPMPPLDLEEVGWLDAFDAIRRVVEAAMKLHTEDSV